MSDKEPGHLTLPKEFPHWYALLSLLFHGWVTVGGIFFLQAPEGARATFQAWSGAEQFLFGGSIVSVLACMIAIVLCTDAAGLVVINGIYSVVAAFSALSAYHIIGGGIDADYLLAPVLNLLPVLLPANSVYCFYRWVSRNGDTRAG